MHTKENVCPILDIISQDPTPHIAASMFYIDVHYIGYHHSGPNGPSRVRVILIVDCDVAMDTDELALKEQSMLQ